MSSEKLFTKSAFKIAMGCPWRLYYARNPETYANTDATDDFLAALAEGGFQVGALAKYYCNVPDENDLESLKDYESSQKRTQELLQNKEVNIAEAAFRYGNLFVRADIIQRQGNSIKLIEVKAKSWNPATDKFLTKDSRKKDAATNTVWGQIREYVYDVAFQKYVVVNALKEMFPQEEFLVEAYLMMADKSKVADFNGMNQLFKIVKDERGRSYVMMAEEAKEKLSISKTEVLTAFDVDDACNRIIAGTTAEQQNTDKGQGILEGMPFKEFVEKASAVYCGNVPYPGKPLLGGKCFKCPFRADKDDEMKSGVEECWVQYTSKDDFYSRPQVRELNGSVLGTKKGKWTEEGIFYLDKLTTEQLKEFDEKKSGNPGLDNYSRKWLQIGLATKNTDILERFTDCLDGESYLDKEGLRNEMKEWKFPLHMIDFETTAVALPYYEGMKPYEQVAFQFSHHIIRKTNSGYEIEHHGQYLNEHVKKFPNFEFVRHLRDKLSQDDGTIFRYATHENTILREIARQLSESHEPDKEELIAFIRSITHNDNKNNGDVYRGKRDMVDLLEVVKRYYYNYSEMRGSNSIKQVLPAVLNTSSFLQDKYGQPIYGKDIKSLNLTEGRTWIEKDANGHVDNPYHLLPKLEELMDLTEEEKRFIAEHESDEASDSEFTVANGGAALVAYNKMMFCGGLKEDAIRKALFQYCELDTLAMVFIWEYFYNETNS